MDKRIKEKDEAEVKVVVDEAKKEKEREEKKYDNLPEDKKKEIKAKVRDGCGMWDVQWEGERARATATGQRHVFFSIDALVVTSAGPRLLPPGPNRSSDPTSKVNTIHFGCPNLILTPL